MGLVILAIQVVSIIEKEIFFFQVNAVKFNEYSSVIVSAGYDRSLRAWDCRSHSTEPIQVRFSSFRSSHSGSFYVFFFSLQSKLINELSSLICRSLILF